MTEGLRAKLEMLPAEPGVYVFRDSAGKVLYVGKAKSLRDRVRSYFGAPSGYDAKGPALRADTDDLEVTVCATEVDALILEAILIKRYRPRYNIILRDDKSYPYIALSMSDRYPRASLVRGKRVKGARYYGPYVNARAAKNTLQLLRKVFPIRHCSGWEPGRPGRTPCLYYDMEMCLGPCTGDVDPGEYRTHVKEFCDFLEGRHSETVRDLESRMAEASESMDYERAARIRNQLESAREVLRHYRALSASEIDYDVVGMTADETQACFAVSQNRSGMHLGNLCFLTDLSGELTTEELVSEFLKRYYSEAVNIPEEILVSTCPEDADALSGWLRGMRGGRVLIRVPRRGKKKVELRLACANAGLALEGAKLTRARDEKRLKLALEELAELLELERYPLRIECYDISTLGGSSSVGSMVVFQDGLPDRRSYRKFNIKFVPGVDDVGMMKEVLHRRFGKLGESGRVGPPSGFARKPDLVLLDGGKGQLGAGLEVLGELGIENVEVAALAKRLEEVFRPGSVEPLYLPRDSEALFLLMRIRDEAHRVAVTHHRSRMEARTTSSWLDNVSGVGTARKKTLIKHFGSPRKVAFATLEELKEVPGIPEGVARSVYQAGVMEREGGGRVA